MSAFWSPAIHELKPYIPGEQPTTTNLIKLNTNESPYPPSPKVIEAIQNATENLRLYPQPDSTLLRENLANYHQLEPEQVFLGNGSDEVLAHAYQAFFKQKKPLLCPDISYSFYPVYAQLFNIATEPLALDDEFIIRSSDYNIDAGGVIFANPNAPTGRALGLDDIKNILNAQPNVVVLVDEAYIDYGGESADALINQYPNLLVVRTFSKSRALAGLRVGYALGHADLIQGLTRVKDSFNSYPLDRLAQAGAIASIKDQAYFSSCLNQSIACRESMRRDLEALEFKVLPSSANFLFARPHDGNAADLAAKLHAKGIIVRHFNHPRIAEYLRISVGNAEQCAILIAAISEMR